MGNLIQSVDIIDVIGSISRKNKSLQARLLQEIEQHFDADSEEWKLLRKYVLDEINGYTRAVIRDIFGDIEYLIK